MPKDEPNRGRTGFSFSRFQIPKLAGYKGRALYLDADMQVFGDIAELWDIPFDDAQGAVHAPGRAAAAVEGLRAGSIRAAR